MEHEIRLYLRSILGVIQDPDNPNKPTCMVIATSEDNGPVDITITNTNIANKIMYILDAYDENMHNKFEQFKTIKNIMIV